MKKLFVSAKQQIFVLAILLGLTVAPKLIYAQSVQSGLEDVHQPFGNTAINANDIPHTIAQIITILLGLAGGIAVLFVLIGGFRYMTAGGNEKQAEAGKTTIINALIGIALVILSYAIVSVVVTLVTRGATF